MIRKIIAWMKSLLWGPAREPSRVWIVTMRRKNVRSAPLFVGTYSAGSGKAALEMARAENPRSDLIAIAEVPTERARRSTAR